MSDSFTRLNALDGRYRIERQLGEAGMAIVYLAADLRHERGARRSDELTRETSEDRRRRPQLHPAVPMEGRGDVVRG